MGQTQLATIPTFDEIEYGRRVRIRIAFRETVEFNDKLTNGMCCFYFPNKETWFVDEIAAANWYVVPLRNSDGVSVVLRTKKPVPQPEVTMSWFEIIIAIFCLMVAGVVLWTWPDDHMFRRSTTYPQY